MAAPRRSLPLRYGVRDLLESCLLGIDLPGKLGKVRPVAKGVVTKSGWHVVSLQDLTQHAKPNWIFLSIFRIFHPIGIGF